MARSVYDLAAASVVENFPSDTVFHAASNLYYRAFEENGRFFQEEFRPDEAGDNIHSLVREMNLVVGSGAAARAYAAIHGERYYAMPMAFYAADGRWALSPGYEGSNLRFRRPITDRCMACHNQYPETVPFVEGKFSDVPRGIGCERCHGPGALHVNERLAAPEPAGTVDSTIVNPAHLSPELRLDVCQQCHLQTNVSVFREGRSAFDYRPSQPLENFLAFFSVEESRDDDEIDIISHADRMRRSECFIQTQAWEAPMECVTCHNPHEGFRDKGAEYFNATCRSCHDALSVGAETALTIHEEPSNCIGCHMPKTRASDAPHAAFTDHWIRVIESNTADNGFDDRGEDGVESRRVSLEAYYERDEAESDVHRGIAYVIYGRDTGNVDAIETGIDILKEGLGARSTFGDAYYQLGTAQLLAGRSSEAAAPLERAVDLDPENPDRLYALAQVREAEGDVEAATRLVEQALVLQPAMTTVRVYYGRLLTRQRRLDEAVDQYRLAIDEEPWLELAHNDLGTAYLRMGRLSEAEASLREAVRLNPDYVAALSNLGTLLARQDRYEQADAFLERAVDADPDNPGALVNLAAHRHRIGRPADSVDLLERALQIEPDFVSALVLLARAHANLGDEAEVRRYARRALDIEPGNEAARRLLDDL